MQPPMTTDPGQVVVVTQPDVSYRQSLYKNMRIGLARQLIGLGASQVVIGVLCLIFQGVAMSIYTTPKSNYKGNYGIDFVGHGFWNGAMFIITGAFGISGGIKRNRCKVIACNVLSILSTLFAVSLIGTAILGAIIYTDEFYGCVYVEYPTTTTTRYNGYYYYYYYVSDGYTRCYGSKPGIAIESMLAILGLIEGIVAIWSSAICCTVGACCCSCGGSCCCCPRSPLQNHFVMTGQPYPGQQQVIVVNQQQFGSGQQPQMFLPNQQPTFLPNWQQPMYLHNQQQPNINLDPQQQMAQYSPQQPMAPPYNEQ